MRKNLDPENTHEKKFWPHEVPTRKKSELTTYAQEEILDPREKIRVHEGTMAQ